MSINVASIHLLLSLILCIAYCRLTFSENRVIGGEMAVPGQFPFQVSLQLNRVHHCGGSLLSSTVIVTAAHCTYQQLRTDFKVIVGSIDLKARDNKVYDVADMIIHPKYSPNTMDYDVSLIKLATPVKFSDKVQKIELAPLNANYPANTLATISGFGAVNSKLEMPHRLRYAQVQLWSRDYCNQKNIPGITDRMVCAGHPSGQISACEGDSGGPLTVENKLFGVVSWGYGCGAEGRPAMYSYIGALRTWILKNMGGGTSKLGRPRDYNDDEENNDDDDEDDDEDDDDLDVNDNKDDSAE